MPRAPRGLVDLAPASIHSRYVTNLEAANEELLRATRELRGSTRQPARRPRRRDRSGSCRSRPRAMMQSARRWPGPTAEQERDLWRQRCLAAEAHAGVAAVGPTGAPPLERPTQAGGLDVQEVASGLIVHQVGRDGLHFLKTAGVQALRRNHTLPEISAQLALAFELAEVRPDLAEQCVIELRAKGVVS